jgi:RNA polymerase sigma factor (sigma-70 family)
MATDQLDGFIRHLRRAALVQDGGGMTDGQLLECFITRRDEAAFEALVRRHGPMVLGVCRRVLRDGHDAEDAFQATFLVLVRKAASIGQRERVGNWLYGAAYRAALEARAARRHVRERQVSAMPETEVVDEAATWSDLRPILDQELNQLPDKYRVPVVLCDLEGRTRREVARQLGIPDGTLSGRLTTAGRLLAKRLARYGFALSGGALAAALSQGAASASVPASLMVATVQAATAIAVGGASLGVVSAKVLALEEGVLKAMFLSKLKITTAVVLAIVATGCALYGLGHQPPSQARAEPPKQNPPNATKPEVGSVLLKRLMGLPDELLEAKKSDEEIVDVLFWTTLIRKPADREKDLLTRQLKGSKNRLEATRDVLWALVNSREFGQLHSLDGNPVATLELLNKLATEWEKKTPPKDPNEVRPESRVEDQGNLVLRLRHVRASDVAKALGNFFRDSKDVVIVAEPVTNKILVRAPEKKLDQIQELIEQLDRPGPDTPKPEEKKEKTPTPDPDPVKPLDNAPPKERAVLPQPLLDEKEMGGIVPLPDGLPLPGPRFPGDPGQQVTPEELIRTYKAAIEKAAKKLQESKDEKPMREALQQLEEAVQRMRWVLDSPLKNLLPANRKP